MGRRRNKSDGTRDPIVMTRSFLLVDSIRNNNIPEEEETVENKETSEFTDLLKSMLNPKVLRDPKFLLIFGRVSLLYWHAVQASPAEKRRDFLSVVNVLLQFCS